MSTHNTYSGNFTMANITGENNNIVNANAPVSSKFLTLLEQLKYIKDLFIYLN